MVPMRLEAGLRRRVRAAFGMIAVAALSALLMAPASAQFWPFGGAQQRPPQRVPQQRQQQQPQQYNPFGNWFSPSAPSQQDRQQAAPQADHSRPPAPLRKAAESASAAPNRIVVLGDAMADWLASGLEDAFAEKPEFGILRRARTISGLIRPDPRREIEFSQLVRETVAADKPKFIVMMVGFHDRQTIRERPAQPAPAKQAPQAAPEDPEGSDPDSPESRARASAEAQNAELRKAEQKKAAQAEQKAAPVNTGPMEFHTEQWEAAYVKRIDATIAALRSAGVPVFWVGLPPQRDPRRSADATYLNELYRVRAERAGIVFVDIWDGFVDEGGRYALSGPDFEGQIRRLRSGDGVFFTKAGARKLAHYVEREIQRGIVSTAIPVALPVPEPATPAVPGRAGPRPLAGPVVPLTAPFGMGNELLGGGTTKPIPNDPTATRVLVRGEPMAPMFGRADDFTWPRGSAPPAAAAAPPQPATAAAPAADPAPAPAPAQPKAAPKSPRAVTPNPPAEKGPPPRPRAQTSGSGPPRPPMEITPYFGR
jgi:hypothetical protein